MKGLWVGLGVAAVLVLALVLVGGSYVTARNQMVAKSADVDEKYSQVNVEQQRRMDLIPNIVASVKGYVNEETTVLTNIANARAGVMAAGNDRSASIKANTALDVAVSPLLRLQEAYPNLKADAQFRTLTDELAGTENRIAVARGRYNKSLEDYNIFVGQFPNSLWAGAKFPHRDEYFKGSAGNSVAPTVDFGK